MLANRLKILLAERDLTIKDVMNAIGLTRPSVSNMVNNPFANVSTKNIDKLCNYLEITPAEFFDYSGWRFDFEFNTDDNENPSLSVTMKSGKMTRTFSLIYEFNYIDPRDPNNNVTEDLMSITASNPKGFDKLFVQVYQGLSPLFQHQIESRLVEVAKQVLDMYSSKSKVPSFFNYIFNDEVIVEANL